LTAVVGCKSLEAACFGVFVVSVIAATVSCITERGPVLRVKRELTVVAVYDVSMIVTYELRKQPTANGVANRSTRPATEAIR